jgi:hypothetical protein
MVFGVRMPRRRSRHVTSSTASRTRRTSLTIEIIGSMICTGPMLAARHRRKLRVGQAALLQGQA